MVKNRATDDNLSDLTEMQRHKARVQRRSIVKDLYAQGYSNRWGFAAAVASICKDEEIPQNAEAIQSDITAVEKALAEDITTDFGRARTLEILMNELEVLAKMKCVDDDGEPHDSKRLTVLKAKLNVIKAIRELEGQDQPATVRHSHTHDHTVHHIVQRLPSAMVDLLGTIDSIEELETVLVKEIGPEDTRLLLTSLSSAEE